MIEVVCSDHQPHEPDAKLTPFGESEPGISGLETLLPLTLKLVSEELLTLSQALALLTANPARILGIDSGHLGVGATADVCIFDWRTNGPSVASGWSAGGRTALSTTGCSEAE